MSRLKSTATPEEKRAAKAAYMKEYNQRPENRERVLATAKKSREKPARKLSQAQAHKRWREVNPRTAEELAKEALRERNKRAAEAAAQGRQVGLWTHRDIDWSDKAQVNEYHRKQAEKYNQRADVRERRREASKEYYRKPEVVALRKAKYKAKAEAEGRQYLPNGRSAEQKLADLRSRWNDGTLTIEKQAVARQAVRILLAHGYRRGLCQLSQRSPCAGRIEGHHWHGYDEAHWTDVLWLCKRHHEEAEGKEVTDAVPYEPDLAYACQVNSVWANYTTPFEKVCSKCRLAKPLAEFHRTFATTDHLTTRCRKCCTAATLESRAKRK